MCKEQYAADFMLPLLETSPPQSSLLLFTFNSQMSQGSKYPLVILSRRDPRIFSCLRIEASSYIGLTGPKHEDFPYLFQKLQSVGVLSADQLSAA